MRKIADVMMGLTLLLAASGASAMEFGTKGTPAFSVDRVFSLSITSDKTERPAPFDDVEADYTHFGFLWQNRQNPTPADVPRVSFDYFVMDSLSIGGSLGYASLSGEVNDSDEDMTALIVAPRVGYVWMLNDWAAFWLRGGFTYHSFTTDNGGDFSENAFALTAEPSFLLSPSDHWGVVLGPTADLAFTGNREFGNADFDFGYFSFGVIRAGMTGWF